MDGKLPDAAGIGGVTLRVADLDRALAFYGRGLGLRVHARDEREATLGADAPFLRLVADPGAPPRPPGTSGLYHVAYLLPTRRDLARALRHLAESRWPLEGASDHLVSEALYLSDPEGNGIEVYADRPRDQWRASPGGGVEMTTTMMDVEGVLALDDGAWSGFPGGARVGHVHLQVGDVPAAEAFYRALGFDLTTRYGAQASFLSAGGYHHHVAVNSWAGRGAPPPPEGARGLVEYVVRVPDRGAVDAAAERLAGYAPRREGEDLVVRDPGGNVVRVSAAL